MPCCALRTERHARTDITNYKRTMSCMTHATLDLGLIAIG